MTACGTIEVVTTADAARERFQSDPDDPRHGTYNGYNNLGCRCDRCQAANAEKVAEGRARRLERPIPRHVHGTENGYRNYGCTCTRCKDAWATAERRRRKERKERRAKRLGAKGP